MPMNFLAAPALGLSPPLTSQKPRRAPEVSPAMCSGSNCLPVDIGGPEGRGVGTTASMTEPFLFIDF